MGTGVRLFFLNDDNTIRRIPWARYERLLKGDFDACFQEYAGKSVRYALVFLELINRKPLEIISIQYSILFFDSEGQICAEEYEKEMHLGAQILMPTETTPSFPNVINAAGRFAIKSFKDRYTWNPNPEIEAAIIEAVFGKNSG